MSNAEQQVEQILINLGYKVLSWGDQTEPMVFYRQVPVGPYRIDFAMPGSKIAIEVDGLHWHGKFQKRIKPYQILARFKDEEKKKYLESEWKIIVVDEISLHNEKKVTKYLKNQIMQFLDV